jgi:hypothetical protein
MVRAYLSEKRRRGWQDEGRRGGQRGKGIYKEGKMKEKAEEKENDAGTDGTRIRIRIRFRIRMRMRIRIRARTRKNVRMRTRMRMRIRIRIRTRMTIDDRKGLTSLLTSFRHLIFPLRQTIA